MVDMVNSSSAKTDQLFSDIDADIARSRRVMQTANLLSADRISSDKWNEIHNQVIVMFHANHEISCDMIS